MKNKKYKVNTFGSNKSLIPIVEYMNSKNCSPHSKQKLARKLNSIRIRVNAIKNNKILNINHIDFLILLKESLLLKVKEEISNASASKYPDVVISHLKTFIKSLYSNQINKIDALINYKRKMKNNTKKLEVTLLTGGHSYKKYSVKLPNDVDISDEELITRCDNKTYNLLQPEGDRCHFGGSVVPTPHPQVKIVTIHID